MRKKNMFRTNAYAIIPPRVLICFSPGSNLLTFLTIRQIRSRRAGPEQNAEARKRGAMMAVNQKCLPGRPEYRNAVTV